MFVEVLLDRTMHDVMDTFKAAVQVRPEIPEAHLVACGFDYLLKTRVADLAAYRVFIGSVIWALPGVRETRTQAVMEELTSCPAWWPGIPAPSSKCTPLCRAAAPSFPALKGEARRADGSGTARGSRCDRSCTACYCTTCHCSAGYCSGCALAAVDPRCGGRGGETR